MFKIKIPHNHPVPLFMRCPLITGYARNKYSDNHYAGSHHMNFLIIFNNAVRGYYQTVKNISHSKPKQIQIFQSVPNKFSNIPQ